MIIMPSTRVLSASRRPGWARLRSVGAAALLSAASATWHAVAAPPRAPESVAPENAAIFLRATSIADLVGGMSSAAGHTLDEKDVAAHVAAMFSMGEIPVPTGAVGLSIFAAPPREDGMVLPAMLLTCDFGDQVDAARGAIERLVTEARRGGTAIAERPMRGRTAYVFTVEAGGQSAPGAGGADADAPDDDEFDFQFDEFGMGGPDVMAEAFREWFVLVDGTHLVVGTDAAAMDTAIGRLAAADAGSLASSKAWQRSREGRGGGSFEAAVIFANAAPLIAAFDPMGFSFMVVPMLHELVGEVESLSMSMDFPAPGASEQRVFLCSPSGPGGLMKAMGQGEPAAVPAAAMARSATSYWAVNMDFAEAASILRRTVEEGPLAMLLGEMGMEGGDDDGGPLAMLESAGRLVGRTFEGAGYASSDDPGGAQMIATTLRDPAGLSGVIEMLGEAMPMDREDLGGGRTLYRATMPDLTDMPEMMTIQVDPGVVPALLVEGTTLRIGSEKMLRALPAIIDQAPMTEAQHPRLAAARSLTGGRNVVAWGWSDLAAATGTSVMDPATLHMLMAMMDVPGLEQADGIFGELLVDMASQVQGDAVWFVESRPDGMLLMSRTSRRDE